MNEVWLCAPVTEKNTWMSTIYCHFSSVTVCPHDILALIYSRGWYMYVYYMQISQLYFCTVKTVTKGFTNKHKTMQGIHYNRLIIKSLKLNLHFLTELTFAYKKWLHIRRLYFTFYMCINCVSLYLLNKILYEKTWHDLIFIISSSGRC